MPPGVEVVDSGESKGPAWSSRSSHANAWFTSAVELPSTLVSRVDQVCVPRSCKPIVSFNLTVHEYSVNIQFRMRRGLGSLVASNRSGTSNYCFIPTPIQLVKFIVGDLE